MDRPQRGTKPRGLPGDSLLFTAGILAASGKLSLPLLLPLAFLAAAAGDSVG